MLDGLASLIRRGVDSLDATTALVSLVESYLDQDIVEHGSNKGPMVEFFQRDGGGSGKPVPWCALFVSSCLRTLERCGFTVRNPGPTGRAVAFWQQSEPDQRIEREAIFDLEDPRGLVFVRTRLSRPVADRLHARNGSKMQGHTGIVISVQGDEIHSIAGNSSGGGHASGTGAVADEVIKKGSGQWDRLVGFVRVVQ